MLGAGVLVAPVLYAVEATANFVRCNAAFGRRYFLLFRSTAGNDRFGRQYLLFLRFRGLLLSIGRDNFWI